MEQLAETLDSGTEQAADTSTDDSASADQETSETQHSEGSDSTESSTQSEPEDEEIDYDGEKFKVPKKLKDAFLRQQDYTQKTQSVAEQRKAVETERAAIQNQAAQQQQFIAEYAQAYALDDQLRQYQTINWQQLSATDPVQAQQLYFQYQELKDKRNQVVATVTQKQQQQALQLQQETARRLQEGRAVLEREIKGWSPGNEVDNALHAYVSSMGIKDIGQMIAHAPTLGVLINKAYQFDQLMKKQATPKEKPESQEKPVTRISASKGTAAKAPADMTQKEFEAYRKRVIAKR